MKKIRYLIYVFLCICLYSLLFSFCLYSFFENEDAIGNLFVVLLYITVFTGISLFLLNLIFHKKPLSFKFIRNIKLILIPVYISFGLFCVLCMIGLIVPIVGLILVVFALAVVFVGYCTIIVTGLPNILFLFKEIFVKKSYDIFNIIALIMHFVFVCDVIISIIMPIKYKVSELNDNFKEETV